MQGRRASEKGPELDAQAGLDAPSIERVKWMLQHDSSQYH